MTIEQRQRAAEVWADAYIDWEAAEEQAAHVDKLRINAQTRLAAARQEFAAVVLLGMGGPRSRVFMLNREVGSDAYRLVKATYNANLSDGMTIELLKTEPNE